MTKQAESRVCLSCAPARLTIQPCPKHWELTDPDTCKHELLAPIFTHNGENDCWKCCHCATMFDLTVN